MGVKRALADFVEQAIGVRIVRLPHGARITLADNIPLLLEEEHLRRFFDYFKIDCVFDVGANAGQYATRFEAVRVIADQSYPLNQIRKLRPYYERRPYAMAAGLWKSSLWETHLDRPRSISWPKMR